MRSYSEESLNPLQDDQLPELTEPGWLLHMLTVPCKGNPFTRTGTRGVQTAPVTPSTRKNHPTHGPLTLNICLANQEAPLNPDRLNPTHMSELHFVVGHLLRTWVIDGLPC